MKNEIVVEVGNIYKRRDGLLAFVYFKNPVSGMFDCVVIGQCSLFYFVNKEGRYLNSVIESPNDLVEVEQD